MANSSKPAEASGDFKIGGQTPVVRLGFGAMRITGDGVWGPPKDHDESIRVLRRAVELGVNFIDTADSYGPAISEPLIAEALAPYGDDIVIATKAGLTRQGPNRWLPVGRPEYLRQQCEMSLRLLKLDSIPLYQLHRIDSQVPLEDQIGEFKKLQDEGKIRHIGLSEVTVDELKAAQQIAEISTVQNRYNLVDQSAADLLEYATDNGIGFIPWAPIEAGKLAQGDNPVTEIASKLDAQPSQVALAWLLAKSPVMLPIPGTSSVAHLEDNIKGATLTLSAEDIAAIDKVAG